VMVRLGQSRIQPSAVSLGASMFGLDYSCSEADRELTTSNKASVSSQQLLAAALRSGMVGNLGAIAASDSTPSKSSIVASPADGNHLWPTQCATHFTASKTGFPYWRLLGSDGLD